MATKAWTTEDIVALCESYSRHPCLFNSKLPNYHSKTIRLRALEEVASRVSDVRPGTTVADVKAKLCSLRSQFVSEHNKVKASRRSNTSTDEMYVPSLWYYKHLYFLAEHVVARKTKETPECSNMVTPGHCKRIHEDSSEDSQSPSLFEEEHYQGTARNDKYCHEVSDEIFYESPMPLQVFVKPCSDDYLDENSTPTKASETVIDMRVVASGSEREDEASISKRVKGNSGSNIHPKNVCPSQEALKTIAKALETPLTPSILPPPTPSQGLALYICGVLDGLKDPLLKIQTTKKILDTLTDAQLQDLNSNNSL